MSFNPLKTHLHLGRNISQRRLDLSNHSAKKLQFIRRFMTERFKDFVETKAYTSKDFREDAEGNYLSSRCQVVPLKGFQTIQQVREALLFFMDNKEIII